MPNKHYKPVVLCILDGWGLAPGWSGNAIESASPENFRRLWRDFPHLILQAGSYLEPFQNYLDSQIMHTTLGAGRLALTDTAGISEFIKTGGFFKNKVFLELAEFACSNRSAIHIVSLISSAQNIAKTEHLVQFLRFLAINNLKKIYLHLILDGVDAPKNLGLSYAEYIQSVVTKLNVGKIATVTGRDFALGENPQNASAVYQTIALGRGPHSPSLTAGIKRHYLAGGTDANLPPTIILDTVQPYPQIADRDGLVFTNTAADVTQNLVKVFADPRVSTKNTKILPKKDIFIVTFSNYNLDVPVKIAFQRISISNSLPEILSRNRLRQLKAAESAKEEHVTYCFSGQNNTHFPGEDWLIEPTISSSEWADKPELSGKNLVDELVPIVPNYNFILLNFANLDLVAHTGDILAVKKAVQFVDLQIGRLTNLIYKLGGALILTADHGNAEQVVETGKPHQQFRNTFSPVPFILVAPGYQRRTLTKTALSAWKNIMDDILKTKHNLSDVAPTVLELLGIAKPPEMTGESLLSVLK